MNSSIFGVDSIATVIPFVPPSRGDSVESYVNILKELVVLVVTGFLKLPQATVNGVPGVL